VSSRRGWLPTLRRAVLTAAMVMTIATGCGGAGGNSPRAHDPVSTTAPSAAASPTYAEPGPNVVGITTVHLPTRVIDVFYPARRGSQSGVPHATFDLREPLRDPLGPPPGGSDAELVSMPAYRDLPAAAGSFPVVLFSHDLGGFPLQDASLESSIAAWGFVVIAPDHVERDMFALSKGRALVDDVHDAQVLFAAMSLMTHDPSIGRAMDLSHVAAVGHAQGGGAALAALGLPGVGAAVTWASSKPSAPVVKKPVLLIGAQHDLEFGTKVQHGIYSKLSGPHSLVLLGGGAGNATFADACQTLHESGTLSAGGDEIDPTNRTGDALVAVAQNGCFPGEVEPRIVWPAIAHFTVAFLRSVFGIDAQPVGLGDTIASAFPKVPLTYQHQP
jgi:dienelactone hydrolase